MPRDYQQFPDDQNGDALWDMHENGVDLELDHEIEFAVVFPSEDNALSFAMLLVRNGQKVAFSPYEENEQLPWQVLAYPVMQPTHSNISEYEELLATHAAPLGGELDGWGSLEV
ncbi:regulator of ribonuclease activity B [Pseudomonas duriflava]|uniref:Regulator of ribonuclease activity B n=1 Tax=Pseudomonas duriflava TaxID=459528 RepID=A0A562QIL8_9PSED|nr:ribonuclease E inhibitor RraB [Pseudomonas duriflava]TWI56597.1 regulator of ribonuclease activity B [Pseudomonas duriflava]